MARCLSTRRHSWAFCWDWDCLSLRRYCITASGLPAALIRPAMSVWPAPSAAFLGDCELADMAEMAESIDEFRRGPGGPARAVVDEPAMAGRDAMVEPPRGFEVTGAAAASRVLIRKARAGAGDEGSARASQSRASRKKRRPTDRGVELNEPCFVPVRGGAARRVAVEMGLVGGALLVGAVVTICGTAEGGDGVGQVAAGGAEVVWRGLAAGFHW